MRLGLNECWFVSFKHLLISEKYVNKCQRLHDVILAWQLYNGYRSTPVYTRGYMDMRSY